MVGVTELEVSLNWMKSNMRFSKLLIQFHPVQWHFQVCDILSAYPVLKILFGPEAKTKIVLYYL